MPRRKARRGCALRNWRISVDRAALRRQGDARRPADRSRSRQHSRTSAAGRRRRVAGWSWRGVLRSMRAGSPSKSMMKASPLATSTWPRWKSPWMRVIKVPAPDSASAARRLQLRCGGAGASRRVHDPDRVCPLASRRRPVEGAFAVAARSFLPSLLRPPLQRSRVQMRHPTVSRAKMACISPSRRPIAATQCASQSASRSAPVSAAGSAGAWASSARVEVVQHPGPCVAFVADETRTRWQGSIAFHLARRERRHREASGACMKPCSVR